MNPTRLGSGITAVIVGAGCILSGIYAKSLWSANDVPPTYEDVKRPATPIERILLISGGCLLFVIGLCILIWGRPNFD